MEYGIPHTEISDTILLVRKGRSLKDQVYELLKDSFLSEAWQTGRLSEAGIAASLGISRTPVREALLDLKRQGLVSYSSKGGIHLPKLLANEVEQIYRLRFLLEEFACKCLSGALSADIVEQLRQIILEMKASAQDKRRSKLLRADRAFHVSLAAGTGNCFLADEVGLLFDRITVAGIETTLEPTRTRSVLAEHEAIVNNLVAGETKRARQVMHTHLQTSARLLAGSIRKREPSISQESVRKGPSHVLLGGIDPGHSLRGR
jgi:DNA-binding GntR family transcriptional regulator